MFLARGGGGWAKNLVTTIPPTILIMIIDFFNRENVNLPLRITRDAQDVRKMGYVVGSYDFRPFLVFT